MAVPTAAGSAGLGILALLLGIAGLLLSCFFSGFYLGIPALIVGVIGVRLVADGARARPRDGVDRGHSRRLRGAGQHWCADRGNRPLEQPNGQMRAQRRRQLAESASMRESEQVILAGCGYAVSSLV
ncbi:hypothetical protein [Fodinicola feengrottensis]|uniref:hypothetical protein n=1 Tax=Fodinicola feengrottensis TaxID=435914 RepID=UPI0024434988|nr:hypothetical protein [Fodinicola feengrottensis]